MEAKQPSRKQFLRKVNKEVAKVQEDALVTQMIGESLVWYHGHSAEEIQKIVLMFLNWKESGSPELATPPATPDIMPAPLCV
jgi:hypothetical protein